MQLMASHTSALLEEVAPPAVDLAVECLVLAPSLPAAYDATRVVALAGQSSAFVHREFSPLQRRAIHETIREIRDFDKAIGQLWVRRNATLQLFRALTPRELEVRYQRQANPDDVLDEIVEDLDLGA